MKTEDIKKRIEKKGYKISECTNGKIVLTTKWIIRVFETYNQIATYFGWRSK